MWTIWHHRRYFSPVTEETLLNVAGPEKSSEKTKTGNIPTSYCMLKYTEYLKSLPLISCLSHYPVSFWLELGYRLARNQNRPISFVQTCYCLMLGTNGVCELVKACRVENTNIRHRTMYRAVIIKWRQCTWHANSFAISLHCALAETWLTTIPHNRDHYEGSAVIAIVRLQNWFLVDDIIRRHESVLQTIAVAFDRAPLLRQ